MEARKDSILLKFNTKLTDLPIYFGIHVRATWWRFFSPQMERNTLFWSRNLWIFIPLLLLLRRGPFGPTGALLGAWGYKIGGPFWPSTPVWKTCSEKHTSFDFIFSLRSVCTVKPPNVFTKVLPVMRNCDVFSAQRKKYLASISHKIHKKIAGNGVSGLPDLEVLYPQFFRACYGPDVGHVTSSKCCSFFVTQCYYIFWWLLLHLRLAFLLHLRLKSYYIYG